jgi:hypothetical protein
MDTTRFTAFYSVVEAEIGIASEPAFVQYRKSLDSRKRKKPEQEDQRVIYIIFDFDMQATIGKFLLRYLSRVNR